MFTLFRKRRHSYGVIPLRQGTAGIEILLINQKDVHKPGSDYWTFPKGTPEAGETPLQTAVRETKEETGVTCEVVDESFTYDDHYSFTVGLTRIDKIVTYYLGRAGEGEVQVQEAEVRDHAWLSLPAARAKLTKERARDIVDAIEAHLQHSVLFATKSV